MARFNVIGAGLWGSLVSSRIARAFRIARAITKAISHIEKRSVSELLTINVFRMLRKRTHNPLLKPIVEVRKVKRFLRCHPTRKAIILLEAEPEKMMN